MTEDAPSKGKAAFRRNLAEWYAGVATVVSMMLIHNGMSFVAMALCIAISTNRNGIAYLGARDQGCEYLMG